VSVVGYIRRSSKDDGGNVSREDQEAAIASLAERHGLTVDEVYVDWKRSGADIGSDAIRHRPRFRAMLRRIEGGDVEAVLALNISRLGRGDSALGRLWAATEQAHTRVITTEGDFSDPSDPNVYLLRTMLQAFAVYYVKEAKRKARQTSAMQTKRGDDRGAAPYGYEARTPRMHGTERVEFVQVNPEGIDHVIGAYKAAGTFLGAAKLLNAEGFPSRRGSEWHPVVVSDLIRREAPELVAGVTQGTRSRTTVPRYLRGLLRCHCGGPMTPNTAGKGGPRYYCGRGQRGRHERPYTIVESKLLPWIKAEAALYRYDRFWDVDAGQQAADTADKRRRLEAARDLMSEDAYAEALAAIEAEETTPERVPAEAPPLDWEWSVQAINEWLRAAFGYVQLGTDLRPVEALWAVPEWRS
jgi:DNA invertase Pin-like site-specific DNA recombinase